MTDAIYGITLSEARKIFNDDFTLSDASDEIHRNRVSIDTVLDRFEYYEVLLTEGLLLNSLNFNLFIMNDDTKKEAVEFLKSMQDKHPDLWKKD